MLFHLKGHTFSRMLKEVNIMKRREALLGSALITGISAKRIFAEDAAGSKKRFGDIVIPPEQEKGKEKHVPIIDAPSGVKTGEEF